MTFNENYVIISIINTINRDGLKELLMDQNAETLKKAISGSLKIIEQKREREIISRRFGLNGNKETLESAKCYQLHVSVFANSKKLF